MGMFSTACRYPLSSPGARDALAVGSGLVLAVLVLVRIGRALWPSALAFGPLALASVPVVLFAGLVGSVLQPGEDGTDGESGANGPPRFGLSSLPVRTGVRFVAAAGVYLVGPTVVLLVTVAGIRDAAGGGTGRVVVAVAGTTALLVALALAYALPAGLAVAADEGLVAGLRVRSLPGLRSGAYFAAWVGALVLVVLAWTALGAAGPGSPLAVLAAVGFAYAHLAAARLAREGLARAAGRAR